MNKFKNVFEKNIDLILKTELYSFLFLVLISLLYHLDSNAHQYYNTGPYLNNIHSFFSLVIILLFGLYFWLCIAFPIIWLVQSILLVRFSIYNRKRLWLSFLSLVFYSCTIAALFSLYSIGQRQSFQNRNQAFNTSHLENFQISFK